MAGYVVVGPWGETSGSVPWPQLSPKDAWKVLTGQIPVYIHPIGPGPEEPDDFVSQMNEARNVYIRTLQDIVERMGGEQGGVVVQATY